MAKVILICGKLCSGKTTYAQRLCARGGAILLSVDEIMLALFGPYAGERHDEYAHRVQQYLLEKSLELVRGDLDIILDWGFWTRSSRDQVRAFYASRAIEHELHYLDVDDALRQRRIARRNRAVTSGDVIAYPVDDALEEKFRSMFEAPGQEEIDVRIAE